MALDFTTYVNSKSASVRRLYALKTGASSGRDQLCGDLAHAGELLTKEIEFEGWHPDLAMKKYADAGETEITNWTPEGNGSRKIKVSRDPKDYPANPEPSIPWLVRVDDEFEDGKFGLADNASVNGNPFAYNGTFVFTDYTGHQVAEGTADALKWEFKCPFNSAATSYFVKLG
jgi:hypothetical protein